MRVQGVGATVVVGLDAPTGPLFTERRTPNRKGAVPPVRRIGASRRRPGRHPPPPLRRITTAAAASAVRHSRRRQGRRRHSPAPRSGHGGRLAQGVGAQSMPALDIHHRIRGRPERGDRAPSSEGWEGAGRRMGVTTSVHRACGTRSRLWPRHRQARWPLRGVPQAVGCLGCARGTRSGTGGDFAGREPNGGGCGVETGCGTGVCGTAAMALLSVRSRTAGVRPARRLRIRWLRPVLPAGTSARARRRVMSQVIGRQITASAPGVRRS